MNTKAITANLLLLSVAIAGPMATGEANATPGYGVTAEPLAVGALANATRTKFKADTGFERGVDVADIATVKFTIAPHGYFGWHRHGGPIWVVIEQGTLTLYDTDIPGCVRTYGPGTAFLEVDNHVHNARNEGAVPVVAVGTFMLPQGAALLTDAPDPGGCVLPPL